MATGQGRWCDFTTGGQKPPAQKNRAPFAVRPGNRIDRKSIVLIVDCEGVKVHPFKAKSYANTGLLIKPVMCRLYLIEISRYFLLKADRKSTRLNSSHVAISYAVFCLKQKRQ